MAKIIYERKYPHKTVEEKLAEAEIWAQNHLGEEPEDPLPSFEELYQKVMSRRRLVLLPTRTNTAEQFIKTAITAGRTYEIDTKVVRMDSHISVTYQFDCGGEMDHLMPVFRQADTVSFLTDIDGFDIALILDYYTHAVYQGETLIHPPLPDRLNGNQNID